MEDLEEVGPWAQEKLMVLQKYLSAYTTALSLQSWCKSLIYVDAFAGSGRFKIRSKTKYNGPLADLFGDSPTISDNENVKYLDGSPRVALQIDRPFSRYVFIEQDDQNFARLVKLQQEYRDTREIELYQDDANSRLIQTISDERFNWSAIEA